MYGVTYVLYYANMYVCRVYFYINITLVNLHYGKCQYSISLSDTSVLFSVE